MKFIVVFLFLISNTEANSQELTADANTLLLLHFNNSVNGAAGETPLTSSNITYDVGRFGQALKCNANTELKFDTTQNINTEQGTIEFWVKPENYSGDGYVFDMRTTNGMFVAVGYYTGIYINELPTNSNPSVAVVVPGSAWFPGTWYHLAFTWGNGEIKMYVNGNFIRSATYNFELSSIPLTQFSIGAALGGGAHYIGMLDEFRISNVARSASEISNSYCLGNVNFTSLQVSPSTINMHPGWEVFLNSPTSSQCPQVLGIQGVNSFPVNGQCINWSVSDPAILNLNASTGTLKALAIGTANLIGTVGTNTFTIPVSVTRLQAVGETDLSVRYIKRLPEIDYVENSSNPTVEGWPAAGQTITWRAHIRNWSGNTYNNVSYEWKKNGIVIGTGVVSFLPDLDATVQINDTWAFQRDSIEFTIDKTNSITEFNEANNSLLVYTDAITLNMYVEQSMYDYFHLNQYKLGVSTNSFDDWMQILHVKRWNKMFRNAIYPETPNGVLDRIRIDSIIIVPDKALPLAGGLPSNNPNVNDKTVDLLWGIDYGNDFQTFFSNQTSVSDANAFYFYGGLLHELGHARYLIDNYAMNLTNLQVNVKEGTVPIAGSSLMPFIAFDVVYYTKPALMSGYYDTLALSETMELNLIAHRRAVCGNMNSPCNIGIFINDLPTNNFITLKDQNNNLLSNACVKIYKSVAVPGFYNKDIDNIPDLSFTADANGIFNSGRNPFAATNNTPISGSNTMTIIIRVEKNGKVGYKVIEATDFNIQYWKGNTVNANYTYQINMLNCGDFSGSSCSCALIIPPNITAGGATSFCEGGSVILTSNLTNGNQWYKDGVLINGATALTINVTSGGSYTAKVTVSGDQSLASNAIVVTVNPIPPTPTITVGGAITFCQGGSATLTSNAASGNQWYKDGVAIGGSTATTLNVTTSGSYTVKVTLSSCTSVASNIIAVTVNSIPPTPTITAGTVTTFCNGGSVTLTSNAASGNQWYKDGLAINGSTGISLNVTTSGIYTTKVTLSGCESTVSNVIVVTVTAGPPAPTITAGTVTTFCNGGSVTLTSNAASGNQWYKNGILINGSTGVTLNVTTSGSYTAKVSLSGCESSASNAIAVTVNPIPPTPTITAGSATTFCTGGSVTLTSNAASGNQWYKDGLAINGSTTNSINVNASGSYTSKATLTGCESSPSNTIVVTVNSLPSTPTITTGSATSFCAGGSVTLTSNAASGNQWYKNGILINGSTVVTFNVTTSGSYTAKVTLSGCESVLSNAIAVTVNPIPPSPIITAGATTTFCTGGSVTLTSNAVSGNQWYKDGTVINGSTGISFNATTSGSYTTKVTLSGCESAVSNAISVTVNPIPATPTITAGGAITFCQGGSVTLTSNAASGNQWYKDGTALTGSIATTLNVTTSGNYTVKSTVSGCESAASNAIAVTVNPIPTAPTITAGSATTFCTGGSVTLTSNAATGNQWYKDAVAISGSTGTTLNVTASGNYTVKTTVSGCESPFSNSIAVTVNTIPAKPTISRNATDLVSSAASGNQWFADGVSINGATGSTFRPSASGQIGVQVTLNGCISPMSDNYYYLITAITDPTALENTIHVFPNPVTNKLSIVSQYRNPIQIQLFDIAGKNFAEISNASGTTELDMNRYTAGCYLLVIKDSKSSKFFRKLLIKQQ